MAWPAPQPDQNDRFLAGRVRPDFRIGLRRRRPTTKHIRQCEPREAESPHLQYIAPRERAAAAAQGSEEIPHGRVPIRREVGSFCRAMGQVSTHMPQYFLIFKGYRSLDRLISRATPPSGNIGGV